MGVRTRRCSGFSVVGEMRFRQYHSLFLPQPPPAEGSLGPTICLAGFCDRNALLQCAPGVQKPSSSKGALDGSLMPLYAVYRGHPFVPWSFLATGLRAFLGHRVLLGTVCSSVAASIVVASTPTIPDNLQWGLGTFTRGLVLGRGVPGGACSGLAQRWQEGLPFFMSANEVILSPGIDGRIPPKFITRVRRL